MLAAVRRVLLSPYLLPLIALVVVGVQLVDPLRRSDLMVFLRAAGDVAHGVNPYTPTTDPYLWGGSAYVYPYLTAFLFVPLTWVPVSVADVIWFVASGGAVIAACRALGLRDPIGITAVLLSATCIRSFQVGAINTMLLLAAALAWKHRENLRVLAVAFTFLAGSKLFLLPVAVWVLLTRSRRAVVVCALSLGAFLGLGLLLEPISVSQFLTSMSLLAEHEGTHGMAFAHLLNVVVSASLARTLALLAAAALLVGAAVYRLRRPTTADPVVFAASIVAAMVATPVYWSHYTVLLVAVLLVVWPTRLAAVFFSVTTWFMSRPVGTPVMYQLPMVERIALLFTLMLVLLALVVRRASASPQVAAPSPAVLTPA